MILSSDSQKGKPMAKSDKPAKTANPMASVLEAMQTASLPPVPQVGTAWIENMADYGQQVVSFLAKRVAEDVQTQHALMHAKDLAQIQHIQAQFFQKAMDDYAAETAKLMELGKALASDTTDTKQT